MNDRWLLADSAYYNICGYDGKNFGQIRIDALVFANHRILDPAYKSIADQGLDKGRCKPPIMFQVQNDRFAILLYKMPNSGRDPGFICDFFLWQNHDGGEIIIFQDLGLVHHDPIGWTNRWNYPRVRCRSIG